MSAPIGSYGTRPLFASLTKRDRDAIVVRLDHALWWAEGHALAVAVTRLLCDIEPAYTEKSEVAAGGER